ncbi:hypothetical protein LTS18_004412, partial [Coniosporium uncinatum]
ERDGERRRMKVRARMWRERGHEERRGWDRGDKERKDWERENEVIGEGDWRGGYGGEYRTLQDEEVRRFTPPPKAAFKQLTGSDTGRGAYGKTNRDERTAKNDLCTHAVDREQRREQVRSMAMPQAASFPTARMISSVRGLRGENVATEVTAKSSSPPKQQPHSAKPRRKHWVTPSLVDFSVLGKEVRNDNYVARGSFLEPQRDDRDIVGVKRSV